MHARIIGVGNADRGDDAAGLLVARRLAGMGDDAVEFTGEALSLMDCWQNRDSVILVDAVVTGGRPGEIHYWDAIAERLPREAFRCSTHLFGVAEAVELARIFERLPSRLVIYGIEGAHFAPGAPPCRQVLEAVDALAERIHGEVNRCTAASA